MTKDLFKDKALELEFQQNGYVKIPFLDSEGIQSLLNFYQEQQFDNKIEAGFHISLDNQNEDLVKQVSEKIKGIMQEKSEEVFQDYQIFTASYVIKEPGKQNIVPPHQDWTFVDESQYQSLTVWTPLIDVVEENGALAVIKGSHKLFNHKRSSPSPQSKSPLADHIFTLFPYTEPIPMKAGEALLFDNRLIHASAPNLSDQPRIAVGIGITKKQAQLKHYYQHPNEENLLIEYEVEADFFNFYNNKRLSDLYDAGRLPEGLKEIQSLKREVPDLSKEEMKSLVQILEGVSYNQAFMERLAALFNYSVDGEKKESPEKEKEAEKAKETEVPESNIVDEYRDPRTFFEKYSPANIVREIIWRLKGRP